MSRELERLSALHNWLADVLAEARAAKTPEAKEAALRRAKWLFPKEPADFSNCRPDWVGYGVLRRPRVKRK